MRKQFAGSDAGVRFIVCLDLGINGTAAWSVAANQNGSGQTVFQLTDRMFRIDGELNAADLSKAVPALFGFSANAGRRMN